MDPASLAIGVAGVLATFDSCMSAFNYIQSGKAFGKDYQKAILRIDILRLKLSRWGKTVKLVDTPSQLPPGVKLASPEDHETVKALLGQIFDDLATAEKISSRFKPDVPAAGFGPGLDSIESLTEKTRELALNRQNATSLRQKAKWALHHKGKLNGLIEDLHTNIEALVDLFPSIKPVQQQLAQQEAAILSNVADTAQGQEAVVALKEASEEVDSDLVSALNAVSSGHSYQNVFTKDSARTMSGDFVDDGYRGTQINTQHQYNNVEASGQSRAHYGNKHGGTYVLDD